MELNTSYFQCENTAIRCETLDEYNDLMLALEDAGYHWANGNRPTDQRCFHGGNSYRVNNEVMKVWWMSSGSHYDEYDEIPVCVALSQDFSCDPISTDDIDTFLFGRE